MKKILISNYILSQIQSLKLVQQEKETKFLSSWDIASGNFGKEDNDQVKKIVQTLQNNDPSSFKNNDSLMQTINNRIQANSDQQQEQIQPKSNLFSPTPPEENKLKSIIPKGFEFPKKDLSVPVVSPKETPSTKNDVSKPQNPQKTPVQQTDVPKLQATQDDSNTDKPKAKPTPPQITPSEPKQNNEPSQVKGLKKKKQKKEVLQQEAAEPLYQLRHKESHKCLSKDSSNLFQLKDCISQDQDQQFRFSYDFKDHNFNVFNLGFQNFIDFQNSDDVIGLSAAQNPEKSGLSPQETAATQKVLLVPVSKSNKKDKDVLQDKQDFYFVHLDKKGVQKYLLAVDDGNLPSVWVGNEKPTDKGANTNNFTFELIKA